MKKLLGALILLALCSTSVVYADFSDDLRKKMREEAIKSAKEYTRKILAAIPKEEDLSTYGWVTTQKSVNYRMPCKAKDTPYSAIFAHGANRMDLLEEDDDGNLVYSRDASIAIDRMEEFCIAIGIPKSGLSTTEHDGVQKWRTWWMTEGVEDENLIPVRNEKEEIQQTIKILKMAKSSLKKPTYLVIGNDLGELSVKVVQQLGKTGEIETIAGIIYVDRDTGEFTRYERNGDTWKSKDNTPPSQ